MLSLSQYNLFSGKSHISKAFLFVLIKPNSLGLEKLTTKIYVFKYLWWWLQTEIVIYHLSQPWPIGCIRMWDGRSCLHSVQDVSSMWCREDEMTENASEVLMSEIKQYQEKMRLSSNKPSLSIMTLMTNRLLCGWILSNLNTKTKADLIKAPYSY